MEKKIMKGYLVIADISGYTSFMASTELEHSQAIMSEIISIVLKDLSSAFQLAEIEGDAVFVFAPEQKFQRGETLLEVIECTYATFIKHRDIMHSMTTCTCKACKTFHKLDLKFIVHYGEYALQKIAHNTKPVGTEVNLVHRLLKNGITSSTGWESYVLFSDRAADLLKLEKDLYHHLVEEYQHLGKIGTYSYNLEETYENLQRRKHTALTSNTADFYITHEFNCPPARLWDILHNPAMREKLMEGTRWSAGIRSMGRTGPGSTNHCAHGSSVVIEKILDWKPFEYFTCENGKKPMLILLTTKLEPIESDKTRLHEFFRLKSNYPGWLRKPLTRIIERNFVKYEKGFEALEKVLKEEIRSENKLLKEVAN